MQTGTISPASRTDLVWVGKAVRASDTQPTDYVRLYFTPDGVILPVCAGRWRLRGTCVGEDLGEVLRSGLPSHEDGLTFVTVGHLKEEVDGETVESEWSAMMAYLSEGSQIGVEATSESDMFARRDLRYMRAVTGEPTITVPGARSGAWKDEDGNPLDWEYEEGYTIPATFADGIKGCKATTVEPHVLGFIGGSRWGAVATRKKGPPQ